MTDRSPKYKADAGDTSEPQGAQMLAQQQNTQTKKLSVSYQLNISSPRGSGPHSEVVLYRGNPWLGRGKPPFHNPIPKISLIYELLNEQRIRY